MMHRKELEVMSVGLSTLPHIQIAFFEMEILRVKYVKK